MNSCEPYTNLMIDSTFSQDQSCPQDLKSETGLYIQVNEQLPMRHLLWAGLYQLNKN